MVFAVLFPDIRRLDDDAKADPHGNHREKYAARGLTYEHTRCAVERAAKIREGKGAKRVLSPAEPGGIGRATHCAERCVGDENGPVEERRQGDREAVEQDQRLSHPSSAEKRCDVFAQQEQQEGDQAHIERDELERIDVGLTHAIHALSAVVLTEDRAR